MIYGIWFGGSSYSQSQLTDVEKFPTLEAAGDALVERYESGYSFRQDFGYVHKEPVSVLTPTVSETSYIDLYSGDPLEGGDLYGRLVIGPHGRAIPGDVTTSA